MRRRRVAILLLALPACADRTVVEQCFEEVWRVELPQSIGRVADAALAADGSLTLLVDGRTGGIVEVTPTGALRDGPRLPDLGPPTEDRSLLSLVIDATGRRWATLVDWSGPEGVWSLFVDEGGPQLHAQAVVAPSDASVWSMGVLGTHGHDLFVAGTVRTPQQDVFEGAAFVGRLGGQPLALERLAIPPGMQGALALVPSDERRLYVLAAPASIDYRDVALFAVDPRAARIEWQRLIGSTGDPNQPLVLGASAAEAGAVVVASFEEHALVLEQFGAAGESEWRVTHDMQTRGYDGDVAVGSGRVVAVVEDGAPALQPWPTPQVVIAESDGTPRCSGELDLPQGGVQLVLDPERERALVVVDVAGSDPATVVALAL